MARDGAVGIGGVRGGGAALSRLAAARGLQRPGARTNLLHSPRQHARLFAAGLAPQPSDLIA